MHFHKVLLICWCTEHAKNCSNIFFLCVLKQWPQLRSISSWSREAQENLKYLNLSLITFLTLWPKSIVHFCIVELIYISGQDLLEIQNIYPRRY